MERDDAACSSIELSAHTQRYEFAAYVFVGPRGLDEHTCSVCCQGISRPSEPTNKLKKKLKWSANGQAKSRTKWTDRDDTSIRLLKRTKRVANPPNHQKIW